MRWLFWSIASFFYLYEFIHRVFPGIIVPELMNDFRISSALVGLISAGYYYSYALFQIPVGLILDKFGVRKSLTIAALMVALGSLIFSYTDNLSMAIFSRVIIGIGSSFSFVGCLKIATDWFPSGRLGLLIGLTNLLGVTGAIFGGKPLALLTEQLGWRDIMYGSGIIGVLCSIAIYTLIRDKKECEIKVSNLNILESIRIIIKDQNIWLFSFIGALLVVPIATYSELWGTTYLMNEINLTKPQAAEIVTITFLGIAIGGPLFGWLSDFMKSRLYPMLLGNIGALTCLAAILFIKITNLQVLAMLHIFLGFFTSSMLICFSINAQRVPAYCRATSIGFTNMIIMSFSTFFQIICGQLIDHSPDKSVIAQLHLSKYQIALLPILLCSVISLFTILKILKSSKKL